MIISRTSPNSFSVVSHGETLGSIARLFKFRTIEKKELSLFGFYKSPHFTVALCPKLQKEIDEFVAVQNAALRLKGKP